MLVTHPERCTGCRICEIVCSIAKENSINPKKARIHIVTIYPGIIDYPVVCRQCTKPQCAAICPVGAIDVDKTGAVLVNIETCTGCGLCANECPYGAITLNSQENVAMICDLCYGEPECIKWCPFGAIELVDSESL
jgi:carbon-monoxide dehydrogenase iron sulfur subunit